MQCCFQLDPQRLRPVCCALAHLLINADRHHISTRANRTSRGFRAVLIRTATRSPLRSPLSSASSAVPTHPSAISTSLPAHAVTRRSSSPRRALARKTRARTRTARARATRLPGARRSSISTALATRTALFTTSATRRSVRRKLRAMPTQRVLRSTSTRQQTKQRLPMPPSDSQDCAFPCSIDQRARTPARLCVLVSY
jgi:hypothetical protein